MPVLVPLSTYTLSLSLCLSLYLSLSLSHTLCQHLALILIIESCILHRSAWTFEKKNHQRHRDGESAGERMNIYFGIVGVGLLCWISPPPGLSPPPPPHWFLKTEGVLCESRPGEFSVILSPWKPSSHAKGERSTTVLVNIVVYDDVWKQINTVHVSSANTECSLVFLSVLLILINR